MQFTALEDFFCAETQSHYCAGLSYTVRPVEAYAHKNLDEKTLAQIKGRCDALAALVPQWLSDGKVRLGADGGQVRGE